MKKIKDSFGKFIGFLIIVGIIVAIVALLAIFGGAIMKIFGFTYRSIGSIIGFFVIAGIVAYIMKSVSATPLSLLVISLVMALLCMNDVIENEDS